MISFPALLNQLMTKDKDFGTEGEAVADAAKISDEEAKKQELDIKNLMTERAGVEYKCLTEGTCTQLHYKQCCSGSGTHMKKVTSWKECAEHCEDMVQKGERIVGCELTDIHKKDDQTGSGTWYAQTACTLQASDDECA